MNFSEIEKELSEITPEVKVTQDREYWYTRFETGKTSHLSRFKKVGKDFPLEKVKAHITALLKRYKETNK